MANATSNTSITPWEYSITFRLRGGARVKMFIADEVAKRLQEILDEPEDKFILFDALDARHALNCKHLLLHHIQRHPGRRYIDPENRDLDLQIVFSDSDVVDRYQVESDSEDVEEEWNPRGALLQNVMREAEDGAATLFFLDDGGDEVNFQSDFVALISIPLEHVTPNANSEGDMS
jgi:hypothetical protein